MKDQNAIVTLDDKIIEELVKELCKKIEEYYIFPEVAEKISAFLLNSLNDGKYNEIKDPINLERLITNDLIKVSNDLHFYFEYEPSMAKILKQNTIEANEAPEDDLLEFRTRLKFEKYANFHIIKAERLPGNIGYIELNDFPPAEFAGEAISGALKFLANSNAFIIDNRNNGGGYPSMVALLISYFMEPNTKLLNTFYERRKNEFFQSLTLPYIPGKRFPTKPLYVLISPRTASGAEEFAYNLKMMQRATLVGETSRGAANPVDTFPILNEFVLWLPIGRPINPISKDNWDGKGVSPHVKVSQEKALETAHILALQDLINNEPDEEIKKLLEFELEYCNTKYNQIKINFKVVQDYEGQYDRYKIFLQESQLYYERSKLKMPLITKDNKTFFMDETLKLWFEFNDNEKFLVLERRDFPNLLRIKKQ
ncbi:MAG: S41 family peptidase [Candidatus Odinarchaeota archaeon]